MEIGRRKERRRKVVGEGERYKLRIVRDKLEIENNIQEIIVAINWDKIWYHSFWLKLLHMDNGGHRVVFKLSNIYLYIQFTL